MSVHLIISSRNWLYQNIRGNGLARGLKKKLVSVTWKQKALQETTNTKLPIEFPNNSSVSRHRLVNQGQSYFPLWSSHAANWGPWLPGRPPRYIRNKISDLQWEAHCSPPCSLLPTHALRLAHAPCPLIHTSPLLSMVYYGFCWFILIIKDFKQHFPQQEGVPIITDLSRCLVTRANHMFSLTELPGCSPHPSCLSLPRPPGRSSTHLHP